MRESNGAMMGTSGAMKNQAVVRELWREGLIKKGYGETLIDGTSMAPTIKKGETVKFEAVTQASRIVLGDIAIIGFKDDTIVHRLIGTTTRDGVLFYRHKGDGALDSGLVRPSQIVGRVVSIRRQDGRVVTPNRRFLWFVNWFTDVAFRINNRILRLIQRVVALMVSQP